MTVILPIAHSAVLKTSGESVRDAHAGVPLPHTNY
jgi:hypothetical protein